MNIIIELTVDDVIRSSKDKPFSDLSIHDFDTRICGDPHFSLCEKADFIVFRNPFGENVVLKQRYSDRAPSVVDKKYPNQWQ